MEFEWITKGVEYTDRVDNAAYHHDLCYSKHSDTKARNDACDKTMLNELDGIMTSTLRERIDKSIVGKLIKADVHFGFDNPLKKILKFTNEFAKELHKQVSKKFERRRDNVNGIDGICAADLTDMQSCSNRIKE